MMTGCQCEGLERQFWSRVTERELSRFRRRGPIRSAGLLIAELIGFVARAPSTPLLDIGGGVGATDHALLDAGVRQGTQVDISSAYQPAAIDATLRTHGLERVVLRRTIVWEIAIHQRTNA